MQAINIRTWQVTARHATNQHQHVRQRCCSTISKLMRCLWLHLTSAAFIWSCFVLSMLCSVCRKTASSSVVLTPSYHRSLEQNALSRLHRPTCHCGPIWRSCSECCCSSRCMSTVGPSIAPKFDGGCIDSRPVQEAGSRRLGWPDVCWLGLLLKEDCVAIDETVRDELLCDETATFDQP